MIMPGVRRHPHENPSASPISAADQTSDANERNRNHYGRAENQGEHLNRR
jgi:hypothetical protein